MAKKLPARFYRADLDEVCFTCDKHRMLCKDCERCSDHCECPEICPLCNGLLGHLLPPGAEPCWCLDCAICGKPVNQDLADYGYGLTEDQAQENFGTACTAVCEACTAVCEACVAARRVPPSPESRGFNAIA
jgi:hypothetical protein